MKTYSKKSMAMAEARSSGGWVIEEVAWGNWAHYGDSEEVAQAYYGDDSVEDILSKLNQLSMRGRRCIRPHEFCGK